MSPVLKPLKRLVLVVALACGVSGALLPAAAQADPTFPSRTRPCLEKILNELLKARERSADAVQVRLSEKGGYEVLIMKTDGTLQIETATRLSEAMEILARYPDRVDLDSLIRTRATMLERLSGEFERIRKARKEIEFQSRVKDPRDLKDKLFAKAKVPKFYRLADIDDVAGARFIVPDRKQVGQVVEDLKRVQGYSARTEIKNRTTGYRAIHVTITAEDGNVMEVQVMTRRMARWSDWEHNLVYKPRPDLDADYIEKLKAYDLKVAEYLNALDDGITSPGPAPRAEEFGVRGEHAFPANQLK